MPTAEPLRDEIIQSVLERASRNGWLRHSN